MIKFPSLLTLYSVTEFDHKRCEFSGFISVPVLRIYHPQCTNTVRKLICLEGDFFPLSAAERKESKISKE